MMKSDAPTPGAIGTFEDWCKLSGLDRHYVRRNYSAVRRRYEADPLTPMASPPPAAKQRDRYDEL